MRMVQEGVPDDAPMVPLLLHAPLSDVEETKAMRADTFKASVSRVISSSARGCRCRKCIHTDIIYCYDAGCECCMGIVGGGDGRYHK